MVAWPQPAAKHAHSCSVTPHPPQKNWGENWKGKSKSKPLGQDKSSLISEGKRGKKQASGVKVVTHHLPEGDHTQPVSEQPQFWKRLPLQLHCWAQCYMACNILLVNLGQLSCLSPLKFLGGPSLFTGSQREKQRKPWCCKSTVQQ